MFSLRYVAARSGARAVPRLASITTRRAAIATSSTAPRMTAAILATKTSSFSTSTRVSYANTGDLPTVELSTKLQEEIMHETEFKEDKTPQVIQEFLDNSKFEVIDKPGRDQVELVRQYGEEKVTITFSVGDVGDFDMFGEDEMNDDYDEGEGGEDEMGQPSPPVRLHIVIEKPGKTPSALNIDAGASGDNIVIDNVYFYNDAKLAHTTTLEADFAAREVYPGPAFSTLDEDVQTLMEQYLEERGIDAHLSLFVSHYIEWKEQKEYVSWLKNVKNFIES